MVEEGRFKTSNTAETKVNVDTDAETKVNTVETIVNTVETNVDTIEIKVNTVETKVNTVEIKVNTDAETKVKLFSSLLQLLLLLLTIFTVRADASITYLKFSDQTNEPIDQAGTMSVFSLSS